MREKSNLTEESQYRAATRKAAAETEASTSFYSGALDRIRRIMLVLTAASPFVAWPFFGWRFALGVFVGCLIAYLNFHWLKRTISALADRVTNTGEAEPAGGIVFRFVLRYGLVGIVGYVILMSSKSSLYGLLGGLLVTVAAILCEAFYEVIVGLRRGL